LLKKQLIYGKKTCKLHSLISIVSSKYKPKFKNVFNSDRKEICMASAYSPKRSLNGKVILVTGGSRGIGLSIAKRAAIDGAKIAIAAKTIVPHPKLPGTIYTAAKEIEQLGGEALAIETDVRKDESIENAVLKTIETFGGIDVLINNASAIAIAGVDEIKMKKFDLMHQINLRGTVLTTKSCLPHLKKSQTPHILTLSPPPSLNPKWFKNTLPYTLAKMGMSFATIGFAEEFKKFGIAANSLWPRTAIDTAAIRYELGGQAMAKHCRSVEIVADAAHAILTRDPKQCSGNFFIDDEVLAEEGVNDLSTYAIDPNQPLLLDFYLESGIDGTMDNIIKMPI